MATSQSTIPRNPTTALATSPRVIGSPRTTHPAAMRIGVLVTNSRACGRLVRARPNTQVQKWTASARPEALIRGQAFHQSWRMESVVSLHCAMNIGRSRIDVACSLHAAAVMGRTSDSSFLKTTPAEETAKICRQRACLCCCTYLLMHAHGASLLVLYQFFCNLSDFKMCTRTAAKRRA